MGFPHRFWSCLCQFKPAIFFSWGRLKPFNYVPPTGALSSKTLVKVSLDHTSSPFSLPKKPGHASKLFGLDHYAVLRKAHPRLSAVRLKAMVNADWRRLSLTEKQPYLHRAASQRAEYDRKLIAMGIPRWPQSPYVCFVKDYCRQHCYKENELSLLPASALSRKLGLIWRQLPREKKEKYREQHQASQLQYFHDMNSSDNQANRVAAQSVRYERKRRKKEAVNEQWRRLSSQIPGANGQPTFQGPLTSRHRQRIGDHFGKPRFPNRPFNQFVADLCQQRTDAKLLRHKDSPPASTDNLIPSNHDAISGLAGRSAALWRQLAPERKQEYYRRFEEVKLKYRQDMDAWKQDMIGRGLEATMQTLMSYGTPSTWNKRRSRNYQIKAMAEKLAQLHENLGQMHPKKIK